MKFNRLEHFLKDKKKVSRYRAALSVLYELQVDQLLLESFDHAEFLEGADPLTANALLNQRVLGFRDCLNKLFSLDQLLTPESQRINPDYGAMDKMIKDGLIKEEDLQDLEKGIL